MRFLKDFFPGAKTKELNITSANGFHLRPVAQFAAVSKTFSCKITATYKNKTVDAKGVNSLLSLSLEQGSKFILTAKGKNSDDALKILTATFNSLMEDDKEIHVLKKDNTNYEGHSIEGDIISSGIVIASLYNYKEKVIQKKSKLSLDKAIDKSINELELLYTEQKENSNANIYFAQKELLSSLKTDITTLEDLEENIKDSSSQLLGSKLESKISDYKDILQRVKKHLGLEVKVLFPDNAFILLANDLLPSQIEELSQTSVSGVILKETSINSHTAILLRAAGITSLIADVSSLNENHHIILDAYSGLIVTAPTPNDFDKAEKRLTEDRKEKDIALSKRFDNAKTEEGKIIKVLANVMDEISTRTAKDEGAEGIGLLRTEFLFKKEKPTLEMQIDSYKKIFTDFDDITVRTLDVGGDKALPYIDLPKEDNPFLGIRGVRLFKTHSELMEEQLQSIFIASKNKSVKIMFPMVSSIEEFTEAKAFARKVAKKHQIDISNILFGIMIEVPSVLFLIEEFNKVVDFYSIGTNDLTQYLFAIERTHPTLKADELSPVIFDAIKIIIDKATKPVSICGELAANKKAIPKLLALGIDTLSVSAKSIAQTKEEIRHV